MRISVFGGNGATGRHLMRRLQGTDSEVSALIRRPDDFPFRWPGLRIVPGDARDPDAVASTINGTDAVLSAIGVPFSRRAIDTYSIAAARIVDAMSAGGVRRLAVTSSSAVEPHEPTEGWLFDRILQPAVVNGIGRSTYEDMRRMEAIVTGSGLDWTIIRPSGLFPADLPSGYRTDLGHAAGRFTSRPDLADFLLRQVSEPQWIGTRPEIHTDAHTPGILRVIWNEGIRRRPDPILVSPALA